MNVVRVLCLALGVGAVLCLAQPAATPGVQAPPEYVLGPDDQITIRVLDVEEINEKPVRVDLRGNINLPMAGRVRAVGLTAEQLEIEITRRLKAYVHEPQVTVMVSEFRSQPVSILGAVMKPEVYQIQGRKTLFEVLSLAGGLRPDAGNSINITRRKEWGRIPIANARDDVSHQFSIADVRIRSVMDAKSPQDNILIQPHDVISVPKADLVYVVGEVNRAGGFPLNEMSNISVLQALSLAGGLNRTAAPHRSRLLRMAPGATQRTEVPLNMKQILAGKAPDVPLQADDILFIPNSAAKNVALRSLEAAISIGSGLAIYRR
jgi:polysaccharide biosynthesis/export protein